MTNEERKGVIEALAWDLVACAQRPPIHPTTAAVLRLLCVLRVVPFSVFTGLLPCDIETTRQQLRRLMDQGLVERITIQQRGCTAVAIYALTADGLRLMDMWVMTREQLLQALNNEIKKVQ
ncbi:MAG: helix-turn-helix transcriptional regulator [Akkermansia sp.]|nr:helix-turn-helix transcriptional regulator [Akkermansia sp.]